MSSKANFAKDFDMKIVFQFAFRIMKTSKNICKIIGEKLMSNLLISESSVTWSLWKRLFLGAG
jgi:hypothetical protein